MEFDGKKLRRLRVGKGFDSPAKFAAHVQVCTGVYVTGATVANLESRRQIDALGATVLAIAAGLGVSASHLYRKARAAA